MEIKSRNTSLGNPPEKERAGLLINPALFDGMMTLPASS
jgi:hypothetical protein